MNRSIWLKFLGVSVAGALVLSFGYLVAVRSLTSADNLALQRSIYLAVAGVVESAPYSESLPRMDHIVAESPTLQYDLWVIDAQDNVIASNTTSPLPSQRRFMPLPAGVHELSTYARALRNFPDLILVRLRDSQERYLLVRTTRQGSMRHMIYVQSALFVVTLIAAVFMALAFATLYLRTRSREARSVIAHIEGGNLGARFTVGRLDSVGALLLDFNRMADEIERLVNRLRATEGTRRALLEELGHDLRTPLTSLRTSIETLAEHRSKMPAAEQDEFYSVIKGELEYFQKLIDDLFFIADIAEPHYRKSAESVDMNALLRSEIEAFKARGGNEIDQTRALTWEYVEPQQPMFVSGDRQLLTRVMRNALDNAAKHARRVIRVSATTSAAEILITVDDDGAGIGDEARAAFGERQSRRIHSHGAHAAVSLGLGSVIIKTITGLHGGRVDIRTTQSGTGSVTGTRLSLTFPRING
jgi:signal transduction histidine kinase